MSETPTSRLIAELERGGRESEAGAWTLDEAAARRKLAEYRLADARVWLCTIVEAATLLGASSIRVERKLDALVIEFNGIAPPLDGLFGAVFAGRSSDPRTRAARKLAIAFETMLERAEVSSIVIDAGSGRLSLAEDQRTFTTREPLGRTSIVVRRGRSWPELDVLAERARYASVSIFVSSATQPETKPISLGPDQVLVDAGAGAARWPIVREGKTIGWLGHRPDADVESRLAIIGDGILAELIMLPGKGEVAVVECSLAKDLGENKLLRDEAFAQVLALVEAARAAHPYVPTIKPRVIVPPPASARRNPLGELVLGIVAIVFAFIVLPNVCAGEPARKPRRAHDGRLAELQSELAHADTFAECPIAQLPGGELTRLSILVFVDPGKQPVRAHVLSVNARDELQGPHLEVARCIEARVETLGRELAKDDPEAWERRHGDSAVWMFEY